MLRDYLKTLKKQGKWKDVSKKLRNQVHEANYLRLNSTKAKKHLRWNTVYSFDECIKETTLWYWNYLEKEDMKEFTQLQIERYIEKAKNKKIIWSK